MEQLTEKQREKIENGREYRSMTMTARSAAEGAESMAVEGYATTFNQPYVLYQGRGYRVIEKIDPHAFDDCDMSDVIFQYDHEGRVFARTRNNTLSLEIDNKGLFIKAELSGTDDGRKLYQEIKDGYIDRMSFGFEVGEDTREYTTDYENDMETCTRTITKFSKLFDVSAVSRPANDMTSISARKFSDGLIADLKAEARARKIKKIKLLMEV